MRAKRASGDLRAAVLVVIAVLLTECPASAQTILDLATARPKILAELAAHQIADGSYGRYSMAAGGATPSYYASLDAVQIKTIMGDDLTESLGETQRSEWIAHLHTFALPDGGYTDTHGHNVLHANGMTVQSLGALGGQQKYPASPLYAPFDTPAEAVNYLQTNINWTSQWSESHKFWGGFVMYSQSSVATTEWIDTVFDWLDTNVDPTTGWWRIGQQPSSNTQGLGGGSHIWPMFEHCGHAFPYPERVIDRILGMAASNGSFGSIGYLNLDAMYGLKYMRSLAPTYRTADIDALVEKHGQWLAANLDGFLAGNPDAHTLLACVGDLGLMNQLAPHLYPDTTGASWTDIFSDPRFYQTAAVEVFSSEPPGPPIGADRPAPYAYTVLAAAPAGYWRLGETEAGSVGEARGLESLQGMHYGLGSAAGAGNVAQGGPRPAGGFVGMSSDNRAVHFAQAINYVSVPDSAELDITGALSLEAWIRLDAIPAGNTGIVAKYLGSGNQRSYSLYIDGQTDDGTLGLIISPDGTYATSFALRDDVAIPLDTWLHVVGTYEPSQRMRLYINGQQVAEKTTSVPAAIYSSSADLWIGCHYNAYDTGQHFPGLIDEVAVYGRALSAAEILEHYRAAFSVWGDANGDGQVDEADAAILASHWGTSGMSWSDGDFNGDGLVDAADASILAANWGHGAEGASSVPEASTWALLLGLLLLWLRRQGNTRY